MLHVVCVSNAANFPIRWLSYKNHVLPQTKNSFHELSTISICQYLYNTMRGKKSTFEHFIWLID